MLVGIVLSTVAAAIIGLMIVRLRGVYFAMCTIAFGQVFYFIAFQWLRSPAATMGSAPGTASRLTSASPASTSSTAPRRSIISRWRCSRYASAAMAFLLRSPFGRTLLAIRENERRARFLGIPVDRHIWMSWVISCFFVSVAGGLFALMNNFVDPRALRWDQSGNFVIMAVLGGMRSFWGPLIGAAIFLVLQDYISSETQNWMSFIGLFFVLIVLFFPRGVLGIIRRKATT